MAVASGLKPPAPGFVIPPQKVKAMMMIAATAIMMGLDWRRRNSSMVVGRKNEGGEEMPPDAGGQSFFAGPSARLLGRGRGALGLDGGAGCLEQAFEGRIRLDAPIQRVLVV